MSASLVLGWLGDVVLWERRWRFGEVPGAFPEPKIPPDQLPVAMLSLLFVAKPFRFDPRAQGLEALIRLFEAAIAHLEGEMARGGACLQ